MALITACAAIGPAQDSARSEIRLFPDDPANPRAVRFEAPSALLVGLPGDRVPATLQARIATREMVARELAVRGYCPNGFTGPEGVSFPDADRTRGVFVVRCEGR